LYSFLAAKAVILTHSIIAVKIKIKSFFTARPPLYEEYYNTFRAKIKCTAKLSSAVHYV
jgi:hypothetical protein